MDDHVDEFGEEEHFEDFTTASDWEVFTANLEHMVNEWQSKPVEPENVQKNWTTLHNNIVYGDKSFKVSFYNRGSTTGDTDNNVSFSVDSSKSSNVRLPPYLDSITDNVKEFPLNYSPHIVSELFHLTEFAVISPEKKPLRDESELKLILSSACIALNNTNSNFPIMVQYHQRPQNFFCGIAESNGTRTSFQMIHLRNFSKEYNYLSGLLALFNSKIGMKLPTPIGITAHFFYNTKVWHPDYTFETDFVDAMEYIKAANNNLSTDNSSNVASLSWKDYHAFTTFLPFGCSDDPFAGLSLVVGWPSLTEDAVVDTSTYSDLDPNQAPEWYFGLQPNNQLDFRLTELLEAVWNLQKDNKPIEEVLGKKLGKNDMQYTSALDKIALGVSPLPVVNRVITNVNKAQRQLLFSPLLYVDLPPVEKEDMDSILNYLFPDAIPNSKYPYPATFDKLLEFTRPDLQALVDGFQGVKSAPMGSLVWRLAIILSSHTTAGYGNVAHIWAELIMELRYRWENSILISGLEGGAPNSATCLLNQKLQMLNCCIEKKLLREKKETEVNTAAAEEDTGAESDEDEFFDCEDDLPAPEDIVGRLHKPTGRLSKCGRLRLLKSGEPLYVPVTQDPAPLTEDGFEEQTKMLVELGDDDEGTEQRAKLMSASLASDMQSFKAANPGCCLEDFVRWYSPRDWIEHDATDDFGNKTGELSVRMKMPGNLWLEVWASTAAVSARRQKRLFDDTQEAEKILSWLRSRTLRDISQLIFPCLAHAATLKFFEEADALNVNCSVPATIVQHLTQLTKNLGQDVLNAMFGQSSASDSGIENYAYTANGTSAYKFGLLSFLAKIEREICQLRSFQQKFPEIDLSMLLEEEKKESTTGCPPYLIPKYIKVEAGHESDVGKRICDIFQKEILVHDQSESVNDFKFGDPLKKVFVLRYVPTKSYGGTPEVALPQRMSCCIKKNEFKVAGTFSTQTGLG